VIEAECAALAAKSARAPQLRALEASIDEMQRELAGDHRPLGSDRDFHLRIAEATGNGALVEVIKLLWDERSGALYQQLEHHYDSPDLWRAAIAEHRAVVAAIAARDPDGARSAMQRHLNQAYRRFSKGWDNLH